MYLVDTEAVGTSGVHRIGLLVNGDKTGFIRPFFRPLAQELCLLDALEALPSCRGVQEREIAILDALFEPLWLLFGEFPAMIPENDSFISPKHSRL